MQSDANRGSLLYEERLERAERRRLAGNAMFQEGRYKDALAKYAMVGWEQARGAQGKHSKGSQASKAARGFGRGCGETSDVCWTGSNGV